MKQSGPKFNIDKSFFGWPEMEYLGFWVTRDDVKKKYYATAFSKRSTQIYRFSELISQYMGKILTSDIAFN